jgi:hypothetical protein
MTMASAHPKRPWSLGAVLAEREVDPQTAVLVVRPDAGHAASLHLRRRLLGLLMSGHTTVVVDLDGGPRMTDAVLAALMHGRRRLAARDARLVVATSDPGMRARLAHLGFETDGAVEAP